MISDRCVSCCRGLPVANHCQSSFLSDYKSPFKEILHLESYPALLLNIPVDNSTINFTGIEFLVEVPLVMNQRRFYEPELPIVLAIGDQCMPA